MQSQTSKAIRVHRMELPTPLPMGTVNAYLISVGQVRVLVDCGIHTDAARDVLLEGLADAGTAPRELSGLVLTHGHVDHIGWTSMFRESGVTVFSHPDVGQWLDKGGPFEQIRLEFLSTLASQMGMPEEARTLAEKQNFLLAQWTDRSVVDVALAENKPFPLIPEFEVLYVPGHAQAAIALWNAETGELFAGDQLLPKISSNAVIEPEPGARRGVDAKRTKSLLQYRENLKFLRTLQITTVYPGHGEPFNDAHALIDERLGEQGTRRDQMLELLRKMPGASAYDIAAAYFPRHHHQPPLILSETLGHLDWLAEDGLADSAFDEQGILRWRAR